MNMQLLNCWEIKKCGRQRGGKKVNELGECIASKGKVGHSCWAFAGTMCSDEIQGTYAKDFVHSVKIMKSITAQGAIWEK